MPETIRFTNGCSVALTICDCALDGRNKLTLTNIFTEPVPAGITLKFLITEGTNPVGSREAGQWSVQTETRVNGVWYKVDGRTFEQSFFAKPGLVYSELTVDNK